MFRRWRSLAIKLDKSKLVRNLAAGYKLVPLLERALGAGDFSWTYEYEPKRGDRAWHPSGHCTPSLRELYDFATSTEVEERKGPILKTFQVGQFWHQYLQEACVRAGLCERSAIEVHGSKGWGEKTNADYYRTNCFVGYTTLTDYAPFHVVKGAADIAPIDIPGHGEYLIDFKSMHTLDFRRNGMPQWCADKYECQINIYMDLLGFEQALIVPILKDSPHDLKEFEYRRNQPLIDAIYKKWELVSLCLDEGVEPPEGANIPLPLQGVV